MDSSAPKRGGIGEDGWMSIEIRCIEGGICEKTTSEDLKGWRSCFSSSAGDGVKERWCWWKAFRHTGKNCWRIVDGSRKNGDGIDFVTVVIIVVRSIFDVRRMNGVRINFVAGGIFVGRRMFEGVDRFGKNGSYHFYFDVEGIVDGSRNERSFVSGKFNAEVLRRGAGILVFSGRSFDEVRSYVVV